MRSHLYYSLTATGGPKVTTLNLGNKSSWKLSKASRSGALSIRWRNLFKQATRSTHDCSFGGVPLVCAVSLFARTFLAWKAAIPKSEEFEEYRRERKMQGKGGSRGARRTVHLLLDLGCPYFHVGRCGGAVRSIQSTAACSSSHSVRSSLGRPIGGSSAAGQEGASGQSITTPPAPRAQPFATLVQPAISKQAQRAPHHHHETNPQAATLSFDNHPHFSPSPTSHPQHQRLDQQSAPNALECSLPSFSSSSSSSSSSHATPTPSAHAHDSGRSTPSAQHRPEDRRDDGTSSNRTATANVEQSSCHITQTTTPASPATGEREHEWGCKYFDINGRQKRHMPPRGHPHHHPEIPKESFFRRELPKHCVSFSSDEGKKLFREALGTRH